MGKVSREDKRALKRQIAKVKEQISAQEIWVKTIGVLHQNFEQEYRKLSELRIKLQALEDKRLNKGAGVHLSDVSIPSEKVIIH